MIADVEKRHRRAVELERIWNRWFPSLSGQASVEWWMVMLDDFQMMTLAEAIRRCAKKRVMMPMALPEMQTFIMQIAPSINRERAERDDAGRKGVTPVSREAETI